MKEHYKQNEVSIGRGDTDCNQEATEIVYTLPPRMTEAQKEAISQPYSEPFIEFYKLPWYLKSNAQSKFIECYAVIRTDVILNMYIDLINKISEGYQKNSDGVISMDLHRELDSLTDMFSYRFVKKFPDQSTTICSDIFKKSLKKNTDFLLKV